MLGTQQETCTFQDVSLAQGHSGASNNWWFGRQHCSYIQADQVTCPGTSSTGASISFVFLRGGNGVNTVGVTSTTPVESMQAV